MHTDLAFELPTGTGKTTVGLLIAEWRRRKTKKKVAFLSLTNQLAKQVLVESRKLGIDCADLTGNKNTRNAAEEGRYRSGMAIGVTTYSNLFNINPVIQASDVLIFDDSHGGAKYASDMWTVRVNRITIPDLYVNLLTALRPSITDSQF
jgi:superfamily II DNA or RNA helicase